MKRAQPAPRPDPDIAGLAAVLADRSRVAILDALLDGEPHAIGRLARRAGIRASTASSHLERLLGAGLVVVIPAGRERRVRLAGPEVAELLERLAALAPAPLSAGSAATAQARTRGAELRFARTCYDHLAGALAIRVTARLTELGWLVRRADTFEAAPALLSWLEAQGQPLPAKDGRRPLIRACLDWSERVPHVAGRTGAALARVALDRRWVARVRESRALRVTERGRATLARELGLRL